MATLAQLDKQGVLLGYKKCGKKNWVTRGNQVAVEEGCDLAPGRYRWDRALESFVPLAPVGGQEALAEDSDAIRAIALGFMKLSESVDLPEETLLWLEEYTTSLDGMGIEPFMRPKR